MAIRKNRAEIEITGKDKTAAGFKKAQNSLRKFGQSAKRIFAGVVAGTAAIGLALAKIGGDLFELGSEAGETASKFNAVFGEAADSVTAFGDSFREMAGITNTEFQALAANAGAIAQGLGFTTDASAALSEQVIRLGADLASFNNTATPDAIDAVNAALVGQTERLRTMGIVLTATEIQQLALSQSGKESVKQLTQQDKATAALALITRKAGAAIGDLARTQNSSANRAKQVRAQFRQLKEDFATQLLPTLEALIPIFAGIAEAASKALPDVISFLNTITDILGLTNQAVQQEIRAIQDLGLTAEQIGQRMLGIQRDRNRLLQRTKEIQEELIGAVPTEIRDLRSELKRLTEEISTLALQENALAEIQKERIATTEAETKATEDGTAAIIAQNEARIDAIEFDIKPGVIGRKDEPQEIREDFDNLPEERGIDPANLTDTTSILSDFTLGFLLATDQLIEFNVAARGMDEILGSIAGAALVNFREGFVEAFEAIGAGEKVFSTLAKAIKRSLADAATAEAKVEIARGVAALAAGLFPPNPAAFLSAGQHFAAAALFGAAAGALGGTRTATPGGGGVGGRGPISESSVTEVQGIGGLPSATVVITGGGAFNMNDPRIAQEFGDAIKDLTGRKVLVEVRD